MKKMEIAEAQRLLRRKRQGYGWCIIGRSEDLL
jgi:hypothetical protein